MRNKKCLFASDHADMGLTAKYCFSCNELIGKSYSERCKDKAKAIPKEVKQKFLDLMHAGKKLGEAKDECGLDLDTAGQIILENTKRYEFLGKEAV